MKDDPLALDPETMRRLGYRTVDLLIDWLGDAQAPPLRRATPAEMRTRLSGPPPDGPTDFEELIERLRDDVLAFSSRVHHPRFFAFIPGAGTWPGALGDLIASAANVYAGSWMEAAGPSHLELEILDWFKSWIGYPPEAAGALVSGGSAANLTALACARQAQGEGPDGELVAYIGDQAHASLARAARLVGLRREQVRVLPVGPDFRLEPGIVREAIEVDQRAGRRPFFVSANAGSTNTGAVDPLPELARVCGERGVWLHADAAYGGFAVLAERGRAALRGLELADSVTLDPHKWLYQPYECGCVLVRDGTQLRRTFEIAPDYLREAQGDAGVVNFGDLGLQLTRTSRALKLWLSLSYFGLDAFRAAVERSLDLADLAWERILAEPRFEPMAPPSLGVRCFRRRFEGVEEEGELEQVNSRLIAALERSGLGLVSSTRLAGRYAIRLCVLNHTSGAEDVESVLDFLATAEPARDAGGVAVYERHLDAGRSRGPAAAGEVVARRSRAFRSLSEKDFARVASLAIEQDAVAGTTLIERWDTSRDFFVVLEGSVEVLLRGERVGEFGPGEFFGELAALDWDVGFGYPRLATVVAAVPTRLLVFPAGTLGTLVQEFPTLGSEIRAAARERLRRR